MIPPECAALIRRFALVLDEGVHRGHVQLDDVLALDVSNEASTFVERPEWGSRHRALYISGVELAVLTFCEGDLCLKVFPTRRAFDSELAYPPVQFAENSPQPECARLARTQN